MYKRTSFCFLLSMILAGCSSDPISLPSIGSGSSSGASSGGAGGTMDPGPDPDGSFSVMFGPMKVPSGIERTQCVVKRLGNPAALHVGKIHNVLSGPSHHLIVYRTADTEEQLAPFDCQPFTDTLDPSKGSPLMITQKHDEVLELPKGVAFTLVPDQMIRLEMHYINPTSDEIEVSAKATFIPLPDAEFENEADFLFIGNPDISIPPHSARTLGPTFFAIPSIVGEANFFGLTGHTHQWGTNVTVSTTDAKGVADKPIYDIPNWSWSEPATVYLDPPVTIPKGGGFQFTCSWENKSDQTVSFGESANAEMCFFWTYYYPSKGAYVCAHTDQVAGGYDICCPGNPLCTMVF